VSLYLPPKDNLNKTNEMLTSELSGAAGIKSKQTKNSVMSAINSTIGSKSKILLTFFRAQALQSDPNKWSGPLLRDHRDRRWQG